MNLETLFAMTAQTETFSLVRGNVVLKIDHTLRLEVEGQIAFLATTSENMTLKIVLL